MKTLVNSVELKQLSFIEQKQEGLKKRNPTKAEYIMQIERLWEAYALARTEHSQQRLLQALEFTITRKAKAWGEKWKGKRISAEDFESVFYEEAWELSDSYNHYGNFYFYETLTVALDRRAIDVVRKFTKTKQGKFEASVLPLLPEAAEYLGNGIDIEEEIIMRDLVERVLYDQSLTQMERRLLQAIYENPDASYRELAIEVGLNHHEQLKRSLHKISKKLSYIFL